MAKGLIISRVETYLNETLTESDVNLTTLK